ncbi:MAG: hypothetical protein QF464_21575, partial [Myxococcota bacterium]|nr:hypothetical protein [Myxococcota bacterium]
NGAPGAPQIAIDPSEPGTADDLHASVVGDAVDPNRPANELTYHYTWFHDDEMSHTTSTVLASQTSKGEVWRVEVRANDGTLDGLAASAQVTIGNTAPSCESAVLIPTAGDTTAEFSCTCVGRSDPDDGDDIADTCAFHDGDLPVADGCTLSAEATSKGMSLTCTLTPHDGEDAGEPVTSTPSTVMNSTPSTPLVVLSPQEGDVSTLFSCDLVDPSTDADGDALVYDRTWYVNGFANPGTGSVSAVAGTLQGADGESARGGDEIYCSVVANDGDGQSNPADTQIVTLQNSVPTGGAVLITPPSASEADILTCVADEAEDPDGQPVIWSYTWYLVEEDGTKTPIEGASGEALTGAFFDRGDTVTCVATPTDDVGGAGEPVESKNPVSIVNSLPSLEGASLSPSQ